MEGRQTKIKLWIDAIVKENLQGIADEIEETFDTRATEKENRGLFKMLLYLSHTANKCDKSALATGFEMWRIGCRVCSNLTEVLDANKYFSSVYHIASSLLDMRLYNEALEICDYILPEKLSKDTSLHCEDMYSKLAHLLQNAVSTLLKESKLEGDDNFNISITMIKYELDITKLAHRHNCWRYVLSKILSYCEKVGAIEDKSSARYSYDEFTTAMLTYVSHQTISLDEHNKEHTYRLIFSIITEIMTRKLREKRDGSIEHILIRRSFDAFRSCLHNHRAYMRCFNLYERLSTVLVRPMTNVPEHAIQEIDACTCALRKMIVSHGYGDAIRWYSYSAVLLLTDLLVYWKMSAKSATGNLSYAFVLSAMTFLEEQCNIFDCYVIGTCRCSDPKKCNVQYDVYNNVALRLKALSVVFCLLDIGRNDSAKSRTNEKTKKTKKKKNNNNDNDDDDDDDDETIKDICNLAVSFSQESEARIIAMKEGGCKQWSLLWPICGAHMYNLGVFCESKYHEKSVELYSMLCMSFVKLEGINGVNGNTLLKLTYPLLSLLHRMTSVHLNNGKYEEAAVVCSLNGLLSSKIISKDKEASECKAYKSWGLIKSRYPAACGLTMLQCLRLNAEQIGKVIEIHLEDYDLIKVCLREIRALADGPRVDLSSSIIAVLDEMESLGASAESYVQGVQWLGYHLLNFKCSPPIDRHLRNAIVKYEREPRPSKSLECSYGHVQFYEFCQLLHDIGEKTEYEIECAKSADTRSTSPRHGESVPSVHELQNIVPTYSTINMTVTGKIEASMERPLGIWKAALGENYKDTLENWEIVQILEIAKTIGEYARLYHLESVEVEAWKVAYNLARELEDHHSIIYVTTRSLSSRHVDRRWIEEADKSVDIVEKSSDPEVRAEVLWYRLSLANFYFQSGNYKSAKELFLTATAVPSDSFMTQWGNFFLTVSLQMNALEDENEDQSKYSRLVVQSLYTILSIDDALEAPILCCKLKQLYHYDVLFEFTYDMTHRMNSLLSWKEITAHLMRRLGTAQKLGAALRVAECLKCLCYIDLSRAKSDDCEVKLQGLEHILEIEGFGLTMKSQLAAPNPSDRVLTSPSSCVVETVRDIGQNNTSPVLRVKTFASPDFITHNKPCVCFKCTNSRYQSLVFAATHLRAQLFSLRRNSGAALQHFIGASKIKRNIMSRASLTVRPDKNRLNKSDNPRISRSYRPLEIVEYVFFHLDYCRFLKWSMPKCVNQGFEVALEALSLCQKYNLKNHPIYVTAKQLVFDYRFEIAYSNALFSKFTVPSMEDMDTGRDILESGGHPVTCVTPSRDIVTKKPISVRRRKTPPFLNLEKVPIDLTEDEPSISPSTPPRPRRTRYPRNITDTQQDSATPGAPSERKKIAPKIKFSIAIDDEENPAKINGPVGTWNTEKRRVEGNQTKLIGINSQTENRKKASTRSSNIRKVSQRDSASPRSNNITSTVTQVSDGPAEIDDVAKLLGNLTVTKTRYCLPLTAEKFTTMPNDGTSSSGNEVAAVNRRSSRLRKKSQDISSVDNKKPSQSLAKSALDVEDEVVIIESSARKLVSTSTENTAMTKDSVKSSRSGRISKRST